MTSRCGCHANLQLHDSPTYGGVYESGEGHSLAQDHHAFHGYGDTADLIGTVHIHLLRRLDLTTCSLSGCRSTGGGRRGASWATCFRTDFLTGTAPVLFTGLPSGLTALSSNLDHSLNVDIARGLG